MQRCKRCNKLISDHAQFCPTCGAAVEDVPEKATPQPVDSRKRKPAGSPATGKAGVDRAPRANQGAPAPSRTQKREAPVRDAGKPAGKCRAPKKDRRLTLALLIAAVCIVAAIIVVLSLRCAKQPAVTDALGGPLAADAALVAPDASAARVETPDVVGMQKDAALSELSALGLVADVYAGEYDPALADGAVIAQSAEAGAWLTRGDHVTLTVNDVPLVLGVLQVSPRAGRVTLSNILEICRAMNTTNPNFDFTLTIHAVEDYVLTGGFRCLVGSGEEEPISRVNTQLLRAGKLVNGFSGAVAYEDSIAWTFALEDWMGFHFDNVTGYEVALASRVDATSGVHKTFLPADVRSMAMVDSAFEGGSVRVDVPAQNALTIRITDDALPDGYTNSPVAGAQVPKWEIKLVMGSYLWLSACLDGTGGEPLDSMRTEGRQFVGKGSQAVPFSGITYTVEGSVMVISVPIPPDIGFDPYAMQWMEITTGDGANGRKIKIQ